MDRPSDGSLTTPAAARAPAGRSGRVALWVACALGGLAQSLAGTAGTLLAEDIGGSATWSGVPQSAQVAGTALASVGLSRLAERIGRRAALALGAGVAAVSCALAVAGAAAGELLPVLLASGLVGAGNAAVLLGRYAAADLGPEEDRARAMGLVLTTITVGAVIGPNLMSVATPLVPSGHGLAGSYVVAGLAFALSGVVLVAGSGPAGRQSVTRTDDADRPPSPAARSARPGLVVLAVANLVMIAVMTVAPVQLHQHGAGLDLVGVVVGVHIASMFAPSSASAWLVGRIGAERVAAVSGLVLLAASVTAAARSTSTPGMVVAMAGLGLGWNLALVAGSTMITAGVRPADRPRREGRGELVMGVAAAAGGAGSGVLMGAAGYPTVALAGAALAVVPSLAAARRTRRPAFGPLPGPVGGPTTPAAVPEKGDGEFFGET